VYDVGMPTPAERIADLEEGKNPLLIAKLPSAYAVLSEDGYLPGYCLLLAAPLASSLEELDRERRAAFLEDVGCLGAVLKEVAGCRRVNYGIYGNVDPFLHCHFWPRYEWEEPPFSTMPPLAWPGERREREKARNAEAHLALLSRLRGAF
jgi:diadenosine tetraphosphate (Ap4A) HIT family hydrolase